VSIDWSILIYIVPSHLVNCSLKKSARQEERMASSEIGNAPFTVNRALYKNHLLDLSRNLIFAGWWSEDGTGQIRTSFASNVQPFGLQMT
jgi:hypothetical protein